ncbi:hypothetical protein RB614_42510 [Phytohabitans sp. ZYX-F-186]|uniref:Bacterial Pleckstrin homology domain-containing protein n=1 Tax=Phytohabitans maris TaxID=3071409 RepID=A0ABU0ZYZ8_9ACTN|nr:hypothetical protein [Phytohabitans sp. ZYX-F-186]MDQ7911182.1 hypothetical protein [Phytohabitans sp. ZYX-F-186]
MPEENGQRKTVESPVVDKPAPDSDVDSTTASTVLAEVLPGVAVVFGEVPAVLKLDLIDFGLVPATDRTQISTFLASIGNTATVAGNLGNAFASAQGLYRLSSTTQALLKAGGTLAVKDGANLGAIFANGRIVGQARLIPVTAVGAAQLAATLGPALAMIALQMQLSEVASLARTNIALTNQVLTTIRHEQWAELTALVASIDRAVGQAREIESVPTSLWNSVAGTEPALRKQCDLYRLNVSDHIRQIRHNTQGRRAYLETNAEAILFDAHALLSSLKAWTGYQALHAARARAAGAEDADEARLVEVIARDTRAALDSALPEATGLVEALTRELRIIVELPGRGTLPLSGKRKDSAAVRQTSAGLLEAIQPLADALRPPAPPLEVPDAVCAPETLDLNPYLRILRWFLDDGETLRVLGFPDQPDASDPLSSILNGAMGKLAAARDKAPAKTLVAVTDRRVITAKTNTFLEQGEIRQEIPIDQVRYVRAATSQDKSSRTAIDLITRDENIRWHFQVDIDNTQVDTLAAVLAESMTIPDAEREELQQRSHAAIAAASKVEITGTTPTQPTGSETTTSIAE